MQRETWPSLDLRAAREQCPRIQTWAFGVSSSAVEFKKFLTGHSHYKIIYHRTRPILIANPKSINSLNRNDKIQHLIRKVTSISNIIFLHISYICSLCYTIPILFFIIMYIFIFCQYFKKTVKHRKCPALPAREYIYSITFITAAQFSLTEA